MARLKVGMAVRIIASDNALLEQMVGRECRILAKRRGATYRCGSVWDLDIVDPFTGGPLTGADCHLAPATDAPQRADKKAAKKADQFIARIKKLGSEPVNAVEKEGVK